MINDANGFYFLKQKVREIISSGGTNTKLKVKKLFDRGNQGVCGVFLLEGHKFVFKLSQYIDYIASHEYEIMKGLDDIADFCPHFCRSIALIEHDVEPRRKKNANPFEIISKYPIKQPILLEEYIDGHNLMHYIDRRKYDVVFSSIKQVLAAIVIAQKCKNFSHYDLHSDNILLEKCSADQVNLYILDDNAAIVVPTYGYMSKMIDFGFSYNDNINDNYATTGISYTDIGFMSDRFDWISDFKLFLVSVSKEIKDCGKDIRGERLRNIAKNIFGKLEIDWKTGWDKDSNSQGATVATIDKINKLVNATGIFKDHCYTCIDIIQSMLILPFEKKSSSELRVSYPIFLKEFGKIESEIGSVIYKMYILKCIVDAAKSVKADYIDEEKRSSAVEAFKNKVKDVIMSVSKFCLPKAIKYELMLCSLYSFSDCVEGILYKNIEKRVSEKVKMYKRIIPSTPLEITRIIDANFEDQYVYNVNTVIKVYDGVQKISKEMIITEDQVDFLNKMPHFIRGKFLLDIYKMESNQIEESSEWSSKDLSESDILGEFTEEE
jgi:hypothetical protein